MIIENYIIPIIKVMFILSLGGFFCYGFYEFMKMILPKELNSWIKFKIMRKKMYEEDVLWCDQAYKNGADEIDVKKHLRINGVPETRINDTIYIFKEIIKMKGGLKSNERQIKRNSLKEFKI